MSDTLRGVGLALVEVPRFRAALERRGERMLARLFSPAELEYARRKRSGEQNLAARFAAKCAGRAALRGVLGRALPLGGLEVTRRRSGEPRLRLRDPLAGAALELFVTITHDADFALASVWVEAEA
ncbi:MAG: holo-[acyl-carrier-protein] synthase [Deltaproteobacteria bacterium]|nr:holo-[acyl-carrier-protein] synthase [Deltaproteobacteria bacterium]